jgi:sRNA-binding carbon storage regulator CsrA
LIHVLLLNEPDLFERFATDDQRAASFSDYLTAQANRSAADMVFQMMDYVRSRCPEYRTRISSFYRLPAQYAWFFSDVQSRLRGLKTSQGPRVLTIDYIGPAFFEEVMTFMALIQAAYQEEGVTLQDVELEFNVYDGDQIAMDWFRHGKIVYRRDWIDAEQQSFYQTLTRSYAKEPYAQALLNNPGLQSKIHEALLGMMKPFAAGEVDAHTLTIDLENSWVQRLHLAPTLYDTQLPASGNTHYTVMNNVLSHLEDPFREEIARALEQRMRRDGVVLAERVDFRPYSLFLKPRGILRARTETESQWLYQRGDPEAWAPKVFPSGTGENIIEVLDSFCVYLDRVARDVHQPKDAFWALRKLVNHLYELVYQGQVDAAASVAEQMIADNLGVEGDGPVTIETQVQKIRGILRERLELRTQKETAEPSAHRAELREEDLTATATAVEMPDFAAPRPSPWTRRLWIGGHFVAAFVIVVGIYYFNQSLYKPWVEGVLNRIGTPEREASRVIWLLLGPSLIVSILRQIMGSSISRFILSRDEESQQGPKVQSHINSVKNIKILAPFFRAALLLLSPVQRYRRWLERYHQKPWASYLASSFYYFMIAAMLTQMLHSVFPQIGIVWLGGIIILPALLAWLAATYFQQKSVVEEETAIKLSRRGFWGRIWRTGFISLINVALFSYYYFGIVLPAVSGWILPLIISKSMPGFFLIDVLFRTLLNAAIFAPLIWDSHSYHFGKIFREGHSPPKADERTAGAIVNVSQINSLFSPLVFAYYYFNQSVLILIFNSLLGFLWGVAYDVLMRHPEIRLARRTSEEKAAQAVYESVISPPTQERGEMRNSELPEGAIIPDAAEKFEAERQKVRSKKILALIDIIAWSKDPFAINTATQELRNIGYRAASAVPWLVAILTNADTLYEKESIMMSQHHLLTALEAIGWPAAAAFSQIVPFLFDVREPVVDASAMAITSAGPFAVRAVNTIIAQLKIEREYPIQKRAFGVLMHILTASREGARTVFDALMNENNLELMGPRYAEDLLASVLEPLLLKFPDWFDEATYARIQKVFHGQAAFGYFEAYYQRLKGKPVSSEAFPLSKAYRPYYAEGTKQVLMVDLHPPGRGDQMIRMNAILRMMKTANPALEITLYCRNPKIFDPQLVTAFPLSELAKMHNREMLKTQSFDMIFYYDIHPEAASSFSSGMQWEYANISQSMAQCIQFQKNALLVTQTFDPSNNYNHSVAPFDISLIRNGHESSDHHSSVSYSAENVYGQKYRLLAALGLPPFPLPGEHIPSAIRQNYEWAGKASLLADLQEQKQKGMTLEFLNGIGGQAERKGFATDEKSQKAFLKVLRRRLKDPKRYILLATSDQPWGTPGYLKSVLAHLPDDQKARIRLLPPVSVYSQGYDEITSAMDVVEQFSTVEEGPVHHAFGIDRNFTLVMPEKTNWYYAVHLWTPLFMSPDQIEWPSAKLFKRRQAAKAATAHRGEMREQKFLPKQKGASDLHRSLWDTIQSRIVAISSFAAVILGVVGNAQAQGRPPEYDYRQMPTELVVLWSLVAVLIGILVLGGGFLFWVNRAEQAYHGGPSKAPKRQPKGWLSPEDWGKHQLFKARTVGRRDERLDQTLAVRPDEMRMFRPANGQTSFRVRKDQEGEFVLDYANAGDEEFHRLLSIEPGTTYQLHRVAGNQLVILHGREAVSVPDASDSRVSREHFSLPLTGPSDSPLILFRGNARHGTEVELTENGYRQSTERLLAVSDTHLPLFVSPEQAEAKFLYPGLFRVVAATPEGYFVERSHVLGLGRYGGLSTGVAEESLASMVEAKGVHEPDNFKIELIQDLNGLPIVAVHNPHNLLLIVVPQNLGQTSRKQNEKKLTPVVARLREEILRPASEEAALDPNKLIQTIKGVGAALAEAGGVFDRCDAQIWRLLNQLFEEVDLPKDPLVYDQLQEMLLGDDEIRTKYEEIRRQAGLQQAQQQDRKAAREMIEKKRQLATMLDGIEAVLARNQDYQSFVQARAAEISIEQLSGLEDLLKSLMEPFYRVGNIRAMPDDEYFEEERIRYQSLLDVQSRIRSTIERAEDIRYAPVFARFASWLDQSWRDSNYSEQFGINRDQYHYFIWQQLWNIIRSIEQPDRAEDATDGQWHRYLTGDIRKDGELIELALPALTAFAKEHGLKTSEQDNSWDLRALQCLARRLEPLAKKVYRERDEMRVKEKGLRRAEAREGEEPVVPVAKGTVPLRRKIGESVQIGPDITVKVFATAPNTTDTPQDDYRFYHAIIEVVAPENLPVRIRSQGKAGEIQVGKVLPDSTLRLYRLRVRKEEGLDIRDGEVRVSVSELGPKAVKLKITAPRTMVIKRAELGPLMTEGEKKESRGEMRDDDLLQQLAEALALPQLYPLALLNIVVTIPWHKGNLGDLLSAGDGLYTHTIKAMRQFWKYSELIHLPGNFSTNLYLLLFALHDIGKPLGRRQQQHANTLQVINEVRSYLPVDDQSLMVMKELIDNDHLFSNYILNPESNLEATVQTLRTKAQKVGLSIRDYYYLQMIYYQFDVISYPALRYVFVSTAETEPTFDPAKGRLLFSNDKEPYVEMLEKRISEMDELLPQNRMEVRGTVSGENTAAEKRVSTLLLTTRFRQDAGQLDAATSNAVQAVEHQITELNTVEDIYRFVVSNMLDQAVEEAVKQAFGKKLPPAFRGMDIEETLLVPLKDTIREAVMVALVTGEVGEQTSTLPQAITRLTEKGNDLLSKPELFIRVIQMFAAEQRVPVDADLLKQMISNGGYLLLDAGTLHDLREPVEKDEITRLVAKQIAAGGHIVMPYDLRDQTSEDLARKFRTDNPKIQLMPHRGTLGIARMARFVPRSEIANSVQIHAWNSPAGNITDPEVVKRSVLVKAELIKELLRTIGAVSLIKVTLVTLLENYLEPVPGRTVGAMTGESVNKAIAFINFLAAHYAQQAVKAAA